MIIILWSIIFILILIIFFLSISLYKIIKKATYLSKKEKEFLKFAIDLYIDYSKELNIESPEQHEYIVKELKRIKENNLK